MLGIDQAYFCFYNEPPTGNNKRGLLKICLIITVIGTLFISIVVKLKNKVERDALQAKLKEEGILSMVYYTKPMHRQGAFAEYDYDDGDFEVTNELCDIVLSLPMHPYLGGR